jgi:hypothetical protein
MNPCHCGCYYETLEKYNKLDANFRCTAEYADGSVNDDGTPKICNRPLGAHPHAPAGKNILLFFNNLPHSSHFFKF